MLPNEFENLLKIKFIDEQVFNLIGLKFIIQNLRIMSWIRIYIYLYEIIDCTVKRTFNSILILILQNFY